MKTNFDIIRERCDRFIKERQEYDDRDGQITLYTIDGGGYDTCDDIILDITKDSIILCLKNEDGSYKKIDLRTTYTVAE